MGVSVCNMATALGILNLFIAIIGGNTSDLLSFTQNSHDANTMVRVFQQAHCLLIMSRFLYTFILVAKSNIIKRREHMQVDGPYKGQIVGAINWRHISALVISPTLNVDDCSPPEGVSSFLDLCIDDGTMQGACGWQWSLRLSCQ